MIVIRIAAALACAFLLTGCLPVTSKAPVGTTAGLGADPALFGTWKGRPVNDDGKVSEGDNGYFHFMQAKDGGMTIAMVLARGTPDDSWSILHASTANLGKNHFINAVETFDKEAPTDGRLKNANIPVLYVMNGRTLTIYLLDEDKARQAVKAGKLKGDIEPGENGDVVITSDAPELDAFMATPEAAGLFRPLIILKKVD